MEQYSADGLISFQSGYTSVSGSYSEQHAWVTLSTSVLEDLNIFDVITAERVVAQMFTEHQHKGWVPKMTFLGTRFENLRVGGYAVQIELDLGICGDKPEGDRSYLEDHSFLDRVRHQIMTIAKDRDLPRDVREMYDSKIKDIDDLRKRVIEHDEGDVHEPLECSLIKSIGPIPIPGVRTIGNLIIIPDFGFVSLADVEVGLKIREHGRRPKLQFILKMLKITMGSIGHGGITAAGVCLSSEKTLGPARGTAELAPQSPLVQYDSTEYTSATPLEPAPAEKPNKQPSGGTTKEVSSIVYPNITVSSEHPVQNTPIDVTVSLDFEKRGPTVGSAQLPEDEEEHVIEVHLLFGTDPQWGSLTFQRPRGTTKAAKFEKILVPVIGRDERNEVPESVLSDITVNFYLNNRWCGEALLTIEILARKNSQPLAAIAQREVMPWRKYLCVSTDAAPPDLLVRIQLSGGQFKWSILSPHMSFSDLPAADVESPVADLPFRFVKTNFEVFTGEPLTDEQLEDLDSKCDRIYDASATAFKKAYWRLFRASRVPGSKVKLESIQFVSDEPYIPWELMRVWDQDSPEPPEILGVRHAVGRWMASESCELRQELQIKKIAVCATSYKDIPDIQPLPWAEEERKYLQDHFSAFNVKMLRAEVKAFLETGIAEVLHFSCHGDMSAQQPEDSSLELEDKKIKPGLVGRPETRLGIGKSKPLVFLNACQVGGAGKVLGLVFGWPQAFLNIGSTACIAPLWSVIDENARNIAEDFYQMTLIDSPPKSLGQALQSIRQQWRAKRSLTYLGYVLYGDPTARITR